MIRLIVIALLIAFGVSSCNSIRYSNYNRPFDFVKLQNNKWKSNLEFQSPDSIVEKPVKPIYQTEIITPDSSSNQVVSALETGPIPLDSCFKSDPEQKKNSSPTQFNDKSNPNFKKGNTLDQAPIKRYHKKVKSNIKEWDNFLLFLLIMIVAIIAFAVIAAYLSSTATGQIILAVVIVALLVAGLVATIAYNNSIFFDILELLFLFL